MDDETLRILLLLEFAKACVVNIRFLKQEKETFISS